MKWEELIKSAMVISKAKKWFQLYLLNANRDSECLSLLVGKWKLEGSAFNFRSYCYYYSIVLSAYHSHRFRYPQRSQVPTYLYKYLHYLFHFFFQFKIENLNCVKLKFAGWWYVLSHFWRIHGAHFSPWWVLQTRRGLSEFDSPINQ